MINAEERNDKIIELRKKGHTLDEIATLFGISNVRVHQICKPSYQRTIDLKRNNIYYKILIKACEECNKNSTIATRIFKALSRNGIISEMEIFGTMFGDYKDDELLKIHGIGKETLKVIHRADNILKRIL